MALTRWRRMGALLALALPAGLLAQDWRPHLPGHAQAIRFLDAESVSARDVLVDLGMLKR